MVDFRERLLDLIRSTGKTLNTVAKESGVSSSRLSDYCTKESKKGMASENLVLLADYFGCSTDYILGRTNVKSPEIDLQGVCQYTGLSEDSITNLAELETKEKRVLDLVLSGHILETYSILEKIHDSIHMKHNAELVPKEFYSWQVGQSMTDLVTEIVNAHNAIKVTRESGTRSNASSEAKTPAEELWERLAIDHFDILESEYYDQLTGMPDEIDQTAQKLSAVLAKKSKNAHIRYFEQTEREDNNQ